MTGILADIVEVSTLGIRKSVESYWLQITTSLMGSVDGQFPALKTTWQVNGGHTLDLPGKSILHKLSEECQFFYPRGQGSEDQGTHCFDWSLYLTAHYAEYIVTKNYLYFIHFFSNTNYIEH